MADFKVCGFEDVEKELLKHGARAEEATKHMLDAAAKTLMPYYQVVISELFQGEYNGVIRSTGAMRDSISESKIGTLVSGGIVGVYPRGKDSKGKRIAERAFVLHYGRRIKAPTRQTLWRDVANERGESAVYAAMRAVWEDEMT